MAKIGVVGARPSAGDAVARHQRSFSTRTCAQRSCPRSCRCRGRGRESGAGLRPQDRCICASPPLGGVNGPGCRSRRASPRNTRRCAFALVREARAVARFGVFGRAAFGAYLPTVASAGCTPVGVPRALQMCVREADDRRVVVLVSGAVAVGLGLVLAVDVVRHHLRSGSTARCRAARRPRGKRAPCCGCLSSGRCSPSPGVSARRPQRPGRPQSGQSGNSS